jgi:hypothetical protein
MRRIGVALAGLLIAIVVAVLAPRPTHHVPPPSSGAGGAPAARTSDVARAPGDGAASAIAHPEIGFRSRERLAEHFRKHGREFEARDESDYLALAQALRDRAAGGDVLEAVRSDGVTTRFDRASGAFIAFDRDLVIRTCFKPNDGESYFRRQLEREH